MILYLDRSLEHDTSSYDVLKIEFSFQVARFKMLPLVIQDQLLN